MDSGSGGSTQAATAEALRHAAHALREGFEHHLRYTLVKDGYTATDCDCYFALALAVRDQLTD